MGRTRLTLGPDGQLRDRDGKIFGRLTAVVVDVYSEEPRGLGGEEVPSQQVAFSSDAVEGQTPEGGAGGTKLKLAERVFRIWAHYQRVIPGAERQTLEGKRRTIIVNALKVRSEAECIAAIDGLARSPHHNGQNEQRKKYLGIQYALKGIGAEGTDERIDKMAGLAAPSASGADSAIPSGAREMVRTRQRLVEDMLLNPGDADRRARAGDSERYLRETWGLTAHVKEGVAPTGATHKDGYWVRWTK